MADKPSYLGLLNAISCAESRAGQYFTRWSETTGSPDVRRVLRTVAAREAEHGLAFAKRIDELGFELIETQDPRFEEAMVVAGSDLPDREKFERLKLQDLSNGILSFFDNVFKDHSIDIATGALLGRYIAEEHDTGRRLRQCYELLCADGAGSRDGLLSARMDGIEVKLDALCAAVDELRRLARPETTNGKGKRAAQPAS